MIRHSSQLTTGSNIMNNLKYRHVLNNAFNSLIKRTHSSNRHQTSLFQFNCGSALYVMPSPAFVRHHSSSRTPDDKRASSQSWSEEWERIGLGARLPPPNAQMTNLLFVQTGFGVDQHGDRRSDGATKAAVRAVRNAIEFNSIPGVIEAIPGGRADMLIHVKLGVPPSNNNNNNNDDEPMPVDLSHVAKVFPYGRLMPIEVVVGGLAFSTGRVVPELGDEDDEAICVAACISIGYDDGSQTAKTYNTKDGY